MHMCMYSHVYVYVYEYVYVYVVSLTHVMLCVGMPVAFLHAGYLLSTACLIVVTAAAICTAQ
jgi:hypothetical protein